MDGTGAVALTGGGPSASSVAGVTRRIVFAPDSFKGSISAGAAATALSEGWRSVAPDDELVLLPLADGGEGTLDAIEAAVPGARRIPITVTGPDDRPVAAHWLLLPAVGGGETAVVELAATSGITLLDALRPLDAHTFGLGEAIAAAIDHGVERLVVALGGSASTDGGAGALTALGARLLDAAGTPVVRGARGLAAIDRIDADALRPLPVGGAVLLTDVDNPLLGPRGATAVFGQQKGLDSATQPLAEAGLGHWAALHPRVDPGLPGAGAAGGTAFGLLAWGATPGTAAPAIGTSGTATLEPGAAAVAELLGLPAALAGADLVVTGEGRFDGQSSGGKAPWQVARLAAAAGTPCALVAGAITAEAEGYAASLALVELAGSTAAALADPARWLRVAGAALAVMRMP